MPWQPLINAFIESQSWKTVQMQSHPSLGNLSLPHLCQLRTTHYILSGMNIFKYRGVATSSISHLTVKNEKGDKSKISHFEDQMTTL